MRHSYKHHHYKSLIAAEIACIAFLGGMLLYKFDTPEIPLGAPEAIAETEPATLLFVGDMMFDRYIKRAINEAQDPLLPFARIAQTLQEADLAIGNLEGPISDRGTKQGSIYSFRFEPVGTINALQHAGFDIVTLANNHIWDYGWPAALDTMRHLTAVGISYIGFGNNFEEANTPVIKTVNDTAIAFLGYTEFYGKGLWADEQLGLSEFVPDNIAKRVSGLKNSGAADLVVVSVHWGEEYETSSNALQQKVARQLIDAGADLIIGHHPHVPQEIEQYKHGFIVYSLGNFVFDQNFSADTRHGLMFKALVKDKKIVGTESIEVKFTQQYQPYRVQ